MATAAAVKTHDAPSPPKTAKAPAEPRKNKLPANHTSFRLAETGHNRWCAELPPEADIADVFRPEFWAHHSNGGVRGAQPGDVIEVRNHDHTFYGELYIRAVNSGWFRVEAIRMVNLGPALKWPEDAPLQMKWNPSSRSYDVVRTTDGVVVSRGYLLREMAIAWMKDHIEKMGQKPPQD